MAVEAIVPCFVLDGGETAVELDINRAPGLNPFRLLNKTRVCVHPTCRFKSAPDEDVRVRLGWRGTNGTRALGVVSCAFGVAKKDGADEDSDDIME